MENDWLAFLSSSKNHLYTINKIWKNQMNTPATDTLAPASFICCCCVLLNLAFLVVWCLITWSWDILFDVFVFRNGRLYPLNFLAPDVLLFPAKCVKLRDMLCVLFLLDCENVLDVTELVIEFDSLWRSRSITARMCSPLRRVGLANWSRRLIDTARPFILWCVQLMS